MVALLSDAQVKAAKPKDKRYFMADTGGLYLEVAPAGGKWWRFRYTFGGKRKMLSLGVYPEVSLKKAREGRDQARVLLASGSDPQATKKEKETQGITFGAVAEEWFAFKCSLWGEGYAKVVRLRMDKYLLANFANDALKELRACDFLPMLREIEYQEKYETAHRIAQIANQIFRYAKLLGIIENNPIADISEIMMSAKVTHRSAILDPEQIGCMLRDLEYTTSRPVTTYALKIMPYVFVRSGELRAALWDEIDFDTKTWTIPAGRMKMRRPHIVPLATQVVELFGGLKLLTGDGEFCFPSSISKKRCLTDVALLNSLRRLGYGRDEMCIHGFRSIASTILNEKGYRSDVIEAQLAHADKSAVRAAYNRAEYLDERRRMMQEYADYLDSLKAAQMIE